MSFGKLRKPAVCAAAVLLQTCVAFASGAPAAQAAYVHQYESTFPVTGQPMGLAVDDSSGSVYALTTAGSLEKFDATGQPSNFSSLGSNTITLPCEEECREVAVDNSGGPNQGVIYVGQSYEPEWGVKVFLPSGAEAKPITNYTETYSPPCGVAVDSHGSIYVTHNYGEENARIDKYEPLDWSSHLNQTPHIASTLLADFFNPCRTAVDSNGDAYVQVGSGSEARNKLHRFSFEAFGEPNLGVPGKTSTILDPHSTYAAIDVENDDLYSDRETEIARFDSTGALVETFTSAHTTSSHGVAINGDTKTVYASNEETGDVSIYKKALSPEINHLRAVTGPETVTFSAEVDPAGAGEVVGCTFEYSLEGESTYTSVPCDQATPYQTATEVTATVNGLTNGATYQYRLTATNAQAAGSSSARTFVIKPPGLEGVYSSKLGETTATLDARVNSFGAATEYFFEYGLTAQYGSTAPVLPGEIAGGEGPTAVTADLTGLQPHTTYHFRVVVHTELGTITSDDQTFNFFPPQCPNSLVRQQTGGDFLPDCRAYELVTPGNQGNIIINPGILTPSSAYATDPARFSFAGYAGGITGTEPVDGLGPDTYVSTRTNLGWVTTLPAIKGNEGSTIGGVSGAVGDVGLDKFFDFSGLAQFGPLGQAIREVNLPFTWSADGSFLGRWPPVGSAIPHAEFTNGFFQPSPDFSHLAFSSSNVRFAPGGLLSAPGSAYDYDTNAGTIQVISKLPNGDDIPQEASIASWPGEERERERFEQNEVIMFPGIANPDSVDYPDTTKNPAKVNPGISTDGSRILMSVSSEPYEHFTSYEHLPSVHLYMRVNDAVTYDVSKGAGAQYIGMTANGSKVFFISKEQLTPDDHDTSADLYMWSLATDQLTRLSSGSGGTGDTDACNASWTSQCDVQAIKINGMITDTSIGSEDGSIYFYSPEQLDGEKGVAGGQNIYLYRAGAIHFVATAEASRMDVSPDGAHMAFVTNNRLTSYDNKEFGEMYSYEPATDKLICVSCNPTGEPPTGNAEGSVKTGLFMSNDGRTFFYTPDALVPKDTNKLHDVYEYADGRPQLITTGTGSHDHTLNQSGGTRSRAGFEGVSADGVNVYFATYETLVPSDENGEFVKLYDARSNGGFPITSPAQPCVAADECHGPGSSPAPATGIISNGELGSGGNFENRSRRATPHKGKRGRHKSGRRHQKGQHRRHNQRRKDA